LFNYGSSERPEIPFLLAHLLFAGLLLDVCCVAAQQVLDQLPRHPSSQLQAAQPVAALAPPLDPVPAREFREAFLLDIMSSHIPPRCNLPSARRLTRTHLWEEVFRRVSP
jgi:hypothetical protein